MAFSVEKLENKPAYLVKLTDFDPKSEVPVYYAQLMEMLNQENRMVSIIMDVTDADVKLDALMVGTKSAMDSKENPYSHPNAKQLIIVTDNRMLKLSIDGFRKLGIAKNINSAESVEAALIHI